MFFDGLSLFFNCFRFIQAALNPLLKKWFDNFKCSSDNNAHVWCYALVILHIISDEPKSNQNDFNVTNCGLPDFFDLSYHTVYQ